MVSNAAFAVNRDTDRERHQLFCIEDFGRRRRSRKRAKGLHRIWRTLPQEPDPAHNVVGDLRLVLAHHVLLPSMTMSDYKSNHTPLCAPTSVSSVADSPNDGLWNSHPLAGFERLRPRGWRTRRQS